MGIRVACPNGHRLHLKNHLAGKRGVCPECGAKFRIPGAEPTVSEVNPSSAAEPTVSPAVGSASRIAGPEANSLERLVSTATVFEEPLGELLLSRMAASDARRATEQGVGGPVALAEVAVRSAAGPAWERVRHRRRRSLGVTLVLGVVVIALAALLFLELR